MMNNNYQHKNNKPASPKEQVDYNKHLKNIGWFYYRYYYKDLYEKEDKNDFKRKNDALSFYTLDQKEDEKVKSFIVQPSEAVSFSLLTTYPGLLIGTGTSHESGLGGNDEFKLGLSFDYTTGLPIIPGSSLKGLLRGAFPNSIKTKTDAKEEKRLEDKYRSPRREYIQEVLEELKDENGRNLSCTIKLEDVVTLENEIFEGIDKKGNAIPVYKRDIFFDAFPVEQKGKHFLGSDYVTPHSNPLKNPLPVQFMKIMPKVRFGFYFKLHDGIITGIRKRALFRQILLDFGIGAKTNVGYGQFSEVK